MSQLTIDRPYEPPRQNWDQSTGRSSPARPVHPSALPPPLRQAGSPGGRASPGNGQIPKESSYVEDVDPRFAEPSVVAPPSFRSTPPPQVLDTDQTYDSIPEGARSPALSEHSNFTSISQRGINPRWPGNQPAFQGGMGAGIPERRPMPQPQLNNILLDSNPDFQLPGSRTAGRGGGFPPSL